VWEKPGDRDVINCRYIATVSIKDWFIYSTQNMG
jgi:hypothetical protein